MPKSNRSKYGIIKRSIQLKIFKGLHVEWLCSLSGADVISAHNHAIDCGVKGTIFYEKNTNIFNNEKSIRFRKHFNKSVGIINDDILRASFIPKKFFIDIDTCGWITTSKSLVIKYKNRKNVFYTFSHGRGLSIERTLSLFAEYRDEKIFFKSDWMAGIGIGFEWLTLITKKGNKAKKFKVYKYCDSHPMMVIAPFFK